LRLLLISFCRFPGGKLPLPRDSHLEGQHDLRQEILIARVGVLEFRVCFREFRLTVFDDRAESKFVTCLRQFESQVRLLSQLFRYRKPLIG